MSKSRTVELAEQIVKHRNLYYNEQPVISDASFDALCDELFALDADNDALSAIDAPIPDDSPWEKVKHPISMGSLNKCLTADEMSEWILNNFTANNSVFITTKLDGISVRTTYVEGKLVCAATRGNGDGFGEDITRNVAKMRGVRTTLPVPFTGHLRGEIILKKDMQAKYFPDAKNPRNTASGVAKRLSGEGCEYLDVMFYQATGSDTASEFFQFKFIEEELKLNVPSYKAFAGKSVNELIDFVIAEWNEYQNTTRKSLDYDIDGLVVRINDLKTQYALGETNNRPRGVRAFKFDSESAVATVLAIDVQSGNSGRQTPVAIVSPVMLAGAEVQRASLYNFAYVNEIGIDVGARVLVSRQGDVIPKILEVVESTGTIFKTPTVCSACGGSVVMNGENLVCVSTDSCPSMKTGRIHNWINELNVIDFGETLINRLVENGLVSSIVDLYHLSIDDLASMERMGKKSATNCIESLWSHNPIPLEILVGGLSIPMIGKSSIELAMDAGYNTLEKLLDATKEQLQGIKGFGPERSRSLYEGLRKSASIITGLLDAGVTVKERDMNMGTGKLSGMSCAFTGTMGTPRKVLAAMAEKAGAIVKGNVGKGLSFLVIDDINSDTTKAVNARKFGTKLISEQEFMDMVE